MIEKEQLECYKQRAIKFKDTPALALEFYKIIETLISEVEQLQIENKESKEDTDRIDWIDRHMDCDLAGPGLHVSLVDINNDQTLREAIDEAKESSIDMGDEDE